MHIVSSCEASQLTHDFVLQIKLVVAICLIGKHKLQVVKAHDANVMGDDCILESLENLLGCRGSVEV